ncbi:MAG: FAD-binding oxidoreductase [Planctomycetota bacterium]|nr:FAD-binding oxidoreductase [Planctomycetota bacterium]
MKDATLERLVGIVGRDGVATNGGSPPVVAPATEEQWVEVVKLVAAEGLHVVPTGKGSKLGWCHPPENANLLLSTRRSTGVVSYEPGDGTLTARAGTTFAELRRTVAGGGHHLTPDVPRADATTLGGVLGAGQSGFDRLRFGPTRNHTLGMRVLLADGSLTKSGGQLVKNVTGYDLHKLYCGSHGTLCVILEASLRLFPLPEERIACRVVCDDAPAALDVARRILALPLRPYAVCVHGPPWTVVAGLAGRAEVLASERETLLATVPEGEVHGGELLDETRELELDGGAWPQLRLSCKPTELARVLADVEGLGLACHAFAHPGIASLLLRFDELDGAQALDVHARLEPLPARLQWLAPPPELAREVDVFGAPSSGLPLIRALRAALDPQGVFAAGRFHGRI